MDKASQDLRKKRKKSCKSFRSNTHTRAAQAYNSEGLQDASSSHNPGKTQKQDDPKNILEAGEVDTHESPHLRALWGGWKGQ